MWGINLGTGQITVNGIPAGSLDEHVYLSTGTSTSGAITISDGGAETVTLTPDADSDVCYTYDANGNLGFKSVNDGQSYFYLWDSLDRLKAIYYYNEDEQEIHRVEYTYNGDGEKIFEIRDGVRTGYLYDAGRLIAEYNASGKVFAQYIHGSGLGGDVGSLLFAQKLTGSGEETSVETSYYFHNWRGDVVAVTGESGNPLDTYRYSAFGEVIEQSGASDNDILFSSKRYHDATALSYFGARYYDASIGRFISRDPLGYIDGPNGYIYVSNNPINLIDPFGLKREKGFFGKVADETKTFVQNIYSPYVALYNHFFEELDFGVNNPVQSETDPVSMYSNGIKTTKEQATTTGSALHVNVVAYNPSNNFLTDVIETGLDKTLGRIIPSRKAKQYAQFTNDMAAPTTHYFHSQGTVTGASAFEEFHRQYGNLKSGSQAVFMAPATLTGRIENAAEGVRVTPTILINVNDFVPQTQSTLNPINHLKGWLNVGNVSEEHSVYKYIEMGKQKGYIP
ncbi:MAG: RHS repeat-associated core domain-containing protein [Candidatus Auribacterota bacterium]|nr:RHS repeat-associated core domain-containing protein [Candidatus Auribacterota bacterium]